MFQIDRKPSRLRQVTGLHGKINTNCVNAPDQCFSSTYLVRGGVNQYTAPSVGLSPVIRFILLQVSHGAVSH